MTPNELTENLDTIIIEEAPAILGIDAHDGTVPGLENLDYLRNVVRVEVDDSDCVDEEEVRCAVRRALQLTMEDVEECPKGDYSDDEEDAP